MLGFNPSSFYRRHILKSYEQQLKKLRGQYQELVEKKLLCYSFQAKRLVSMDVIDPDAKPRYGYCDFTSIINPISGMIRYKIPVILKQAIKQMLSSLINDIEGSNLLAIDKVREKISIYEDHMLLLKGVHAFVNDSGKLRIREFFQPVFHMELPEELGLLVMMSPKGGSYFSKENQDAVKDVMDKFKKHLELGENLTKMFLENLKKHKCYYLDRITLCSRCKSKKYPFQELIDKLDQKQQSKETEMNYYTI